MHSIRLTENVLSNSLSVYVRSFSLVHITVLFDVELAVLKHCVKATFSCYRQRISIIVICEHSCVICDHSCVICDHRCVICDYSCVICDHSCVICDHSCVICDLLCTLCY